MEKKNKLPEKEGDDDPLERIIDDAIEVTAEIASDFDKAVEFTSGAIAASLSGKLKPLTGKTEDFSGAKGIEQIGEQVKYSKEIIKRQQQGPPDFDNIFSGR